MINLSRFTKKQITDLGSTIKSTSPKAFSKKKKFQIGWAKYTKRITINYVLMGISYSYATANYFWICLIKGAGNRDDDRHYITEFEHN